MFSLKVFQQSNEGQGWCMNHMKMINEWTTNEQILITFKNNNDVNQIVEACFELQSHFKVES